MSNVHVEILTIGREILDGRVIDTNAVFLAEALRERGLVPRYAQKVDDDLERIQNAFGVAAARANVILVTGGLGPTSDDITAEAFAKFLKEPLELKADALVQLEARLKLINRPMTESQKKQALHPRSCYVLANPEGTAPGFAYDGKQKWFFMPGVPREMKRMMREQVAPKLPKIEGYRGRQWATQFTAEATLQEILTPIERNLPAGFEVTYRTRFPENHIGLHGDCATSERRALFDQAAAAISAALGTDVFATSDGDLPLLEKVLVEALSAKGALLATIESCTGGLIANRITEISGSSAVFWFAEVNYENKAKEVLGVHRALIDKHGAVSKEVAIALAEAGLAKFRLMNPHSKKLYVLSTTGIAGPTGGTNKKPVGLCHIALASNENPTRHEEIRARAGLDRGLLKGLFAQKALDLLRRELLA